MIQLHFLAKLQAQYVSNRDASHIGPAQYEVNQAAYSITHHMPQLGSLVLCLARVSR